LPGWKAHRKLKATSFPVARARIKGFKTTRFATAMGFATTMKSKASPKPPAATAEFDANQSLLETFAINERANQKLISRQDVMDALSRSAKLLEKGLHDAIGRVPNFKPDAVAFAGYLIAHDSHHRGPISMLARQLGMPVDSKASYGLWEWGTLWKECGFSR
jgi:hypothetical protein